jgi:hypothetical protein
MVNGRKNRHSTFGIVGLIIEIEQNAVIAVFFCLPLVKGVPDLSGEGFKKLELCLNPVF